MLLEQEISLWVNRGFIQADQGETLRQHYATQSTPKRVWAHPGTSLWLAIGGCLVGFGLLLLLTYQWSLYPIWVKTLFAALLLVASQGCFWWTPKPASSPILKDLFLLMFGLGTGLSFFLLNATWQFWSYHGWLGLWVGFLALGAWVSGRNSLTYFMMILCQLWFVQHFSWVEGGLLLALVGWQLVSNNWLSATPKTGLLPAAWLLFTAMGLMQVFNGGPFSLYFLGLGLFFSLLIVRHTPKLHWPPDSAIGVSFLGLMALCLFGTFKLQWPSLIQSVLPTTVYLGWASTVLLMGLVGLWGLALWQNKARRSAGLGFGAGVPGLVLLAGLWRLAPTPVWPIQTAFLVLGLFWSVWLVREGLSRNQLAWINVGGIYGTLLVATFFFHQAFGAGLQGLALLILGSAIIGLNLYARRKS
ncbi:MAG: DUF2157 domain-containing protein [Candidatus Margulisiibacteriota bacterium]